MGGSCICDCDCDCIFCSCLAAVTRRRLGGIWEWDGHGWRCWDLKVAFSCTGSLDYTQGTMTGKGDSCIEEFNE
jgi:hypothetical protein